MPNRLAQETSPYLRQHAGNPVDWHPWGAEALRLAREQNKPILLSIGYSACHWCHVMAHESFEDADVAAGMNAHFINIKVDREERPDLDQIYQLAHQLITRRAGGWPLTMFLTPDGVPFFGGTYFPKTGRYQLPGFVDLLPQVAAYYASRQDEIAELKTGFDAAFSQLESAQTAHHSAFGAQPLTAALDRLRDSFDPIWGGFSVAPKFPRPSEVEFCLRRSATGRDSTARQGALHMAVTTLTRMAEGGLFDHLGGGFCRYSTDGEWTIPHFEKMLYDNGPLLRLYADAWQITRDPLFQQVAEQTAGWVMRDMQSPDGGYYSSLDADSEGEEGKYYVWTPAEVAALLTADEYAVAAPFYGLERPANFEGRHWHLRVSAKLDDLAARLAMTPAECAVKLSTARAKLFAARHLRVPPGRDEKILVSWNALMIAGMARAGRIFGRPEWIASARRSLAFIRTTMWRNERLYATYKDGRAHLNAYLDDYAFLLDALLELLQTEFRSEDVRFAEELADVLLEQFEDQKAGGFFFTSHDHEPLLHRPKPGYDNATPSGNGVAAYCLQRLAWLTNDVRYQQAAERTLRLFYRSFAAHPSACTSLLATLEEALFPATLIVLRGPVEGLPSWQQALHRDHAPSRQVLAIPNGTPALPPTLAKPESPTVSAWVCAGVKCLPPIDSLQALREQIEHLQVE